MTPTVQGRRRRLTAGIAIASAALLLAACTPTADPSETPDGPVELRMVMWSSNEAHHKIFDQIGAAYVAAHPDKVSRISFEALAGDNYINALTTQIAGGEFPDLAWATETYAQQFVQQGVFSDLTPTFQSTEGYEFDDLLPGAMELWTKDGDAYGYPFSNSPGGIYVNLDLLKAAGQPNPRDLIASGDWTWETAAKIGLAVAQSGDVAGLLLNPYTDTINGIGSVWPSWGVAPWTADGTECTMNSRDMVDFFEWLHSEIFVKGSIPGPGEKYDFASGQVGLQMGQLSFSAGLGDGFQWDFVPMPAGPAGDVPVVGQGGVGVVAKGPHPKIAADFLAYFTNPENSALLAQFFPPPRKSLLTVDVLGAAAPALNEEQLKTTIIDQALTAETKVGHPRMSEIAEPLRIAMDSMWVPDADIPEVLNQVCTEINPILQGS